MIDTIDSKVKTVLLYLLTYDIKKTQELKNLSNDEWVEVIRIAKVHHVKEYLYYNVKKNNLLSLLSDELQEDLKNSFKNQTFKNMALQAELNRVSKELDKHSIPLIALKGSHLIGSIYPHIALRHSRDLDILVPKDRAKDVYEIVQKLDYVSEKELSEMDYNFTYSHHLHQMLNKKKSTILEVHVYISQSIKINTKLLWLNAEDSLRKSTPYKLFNLEDLILHLAIHITYSDLFKSDLRHYLDIYVILEEKFEDISWNLLIQRATENNILIGLCITFQIVSKLFNITIPKEISILIKDDKIYNDIVNNAVDFLWLYDKSSENYLFYREKHQLIVSNNNLITNIFKRVFIPKKELAYKYSQKLNSSKLLLYYIVRLFDLFRIHTLNTVKIKTDKRKVEFVKKTKQTYEFFHNKETNVPL